MDKKRIFKVGYEIMDQETKELLFDDYANYYHLDKATCNELERVVVKAVTTALLELGVKKYGG